MILCSKEGEEKSHIVSKLLLYKKSFVLKHSQQEYQAYLKNHFVYGAGHFCSEAASHRASIIDPDKYEQFYLRIM